MLSKGLRDEEKEEIDRVLSTMQEMGFVPDLWEKEQRELLNKKLEKILELSLNDIENIKTEDLLERLKNKGFEFSHYENFGDILIKTIPLEPEEKEVSLASHAIAVYETAQKESNMFSFGLMQKINTAKSYI
ncbi:MAG: hypothetical protein WCD31_03015 [Gillisia sp.]